MNQSHRFGELMNQSHRLGELTTKCRKWNYLHVTMCNGGGFFLACEDFGERFWGKVLGKGLKIHSPPASFFFQEVEIHSCINSTF